jgi:Bacterial alpha-L-rhamnosidase 6 hairpin glycosidase domain
MALLLPTYTLSESDLGMGASFGNSALWIHTKGTGAIERVFLNEIGRSLVGAVSVRYGAHARVDLRGGDAHRQDETFSGIYPERGGRTFEIHPAYQRVKFRLASVIDVEETTFLPLLAASPSDRDPPIAYFTVNLCNLDDAAHPVRLSASAMFRGSTPADIQAHYDDQAGALVAYNASRPEWVRVFGVSEKPVRYSASVDFGAVYDPTHLHALSNDTNARGDLIGCLQIDLMMEPHQSRQVCFMLALGAAGVEQALRNFGQTETADEILQRSVENLKVELRRSRVLTPDSVINQGALWSKVNMRRVMAAYNIGNAFTNDPGKYAIVVVRDCAWFVYGNDHFLPGFSRGLLDCITARQYPSGKLPEYIDAVDGTVEDYGLNINDGTPLYILAVNHHFRSLGDIEWLRTVYPAVARAARYIISQMDDRGLVYCSANDERGNVWAIAGWRNIIADYKINGAVTELNAECVAALRAAAHLAENLGNLEEDARAFRDASDRVKSAMDQHLINPENGLYYLNIDVEGNARTDVTGDEIFPVVMRACSEETGFGIISRLNGSDFWTDAGLRTVSRLDPRYDPEACSGLLGGVWPGLTWWYAFGAARYHPSVMVRALRSSFAHYGADPKRNNTAPGQFSEWFDGESLENRGMRLSPWEPPRFLWAAVEGVCGLVLQPGVARINPLIPHHWTWVGLRDLPYHGSLLSYFIVREADAGFRIYSTAPVESDWDIAVYDTDVSDSIRVFEENVVALALSRQNGAAVLIGNTGNQTVHTPIMYTGPLTLGTHYEARTYNSERVAWEENGILSIDDLRSHALTIEAGGFRLIELSIPSFSPARSGNE